MNQIFETFLKDKFEKSKSAFLGTPDLHPLLEQFKPIIEMIDIEVMALSFSSEISKNLKDWWTNKEKGIDKEEELLAILFTYGALDETACEALAYGITQSEVSPKIQPEPYLLKYHDYAEGFYAMPGITLDARESLNRLHWRNIDQEMYGDVDVYDLDGRHELFNTYRHSLELALHYALIKVRDNGELSQLKMNRPFHFLLQEHDEKVRPILILE